MNVYQLLRTVSLPRFSTFIDMGLGISFGFGPLRFSTHTGGGGGGDGDGDNTWLKMLLGAGLVAIVTTIVGLIDGFFNNLGIDIEFVLLYWVIFQGVPVALVLASSIFLTMLVFGLIYQKGWPKRFDFVLPVCVFISTIIFIVGFHKIPLMNPDLVMLSQEESWELYGRNNAAFVAPVGHWLYLYLGALFSAPTILLVIFLGTKFFSRQTVRVLDSKATKKEALD